MTSIISRAAWGFNGWSKGLSITRSRSEFMIHYEGGHPCGKQIGAAMMRSIHAFHKNGRGWSGVGYNFVIDQAGNIFEGRGWRGVGAHCPGHNTSAIGVQVHIGGSEQPSAKALASLAWLHHEAERRYGHLRVMGHGQGYSTECPGGPLRAVVARMARGQGTGATPTQPVVNPSGGVLVDGRWGPRTARALASALKVTGWRSTRDYWRRISRALGVSPAQITGDPGPAVFARLSEWLGIRPVRGAHLDGRYDPVVARIQVVSNGVLAKRSKK